MLPTKTLSENKEILWEKLLIQNPHSNGHLTSFKMTESIITHVIYPTAELRVDSGYRELNWTF